MSPIKNLKGTYQKRNSLLGGKTSRCPSQGPYVGGSETNRKNRCLIQQWRATEYSNAKKQCNRSCSGLMWSQLGEQVRVERD